MRKVIPVNLNGCPVALHAQYGMHSLQHCISVSYCGTIHLSNNGI